MYLERIKDGSEFGPLEAELMVFSCASMMRQEASRSLKEVGQTRES